MVEIKASCGYFTVFISYNILFWGLFAVVANWGGLYFIELPKYINWLYVGIGFAWLTRTNIYVIFCYIFTCYGFSVVQEKHI